MNLALADVTALIISYLIAMLLRFRGGATDWQWQFYNTWFAISAFILVFHHQVKAFLGRSKKLTDQDPDELVAESLHIVIINMAILVGMLFLLHQSWKISRLMLGYWTLFFFLCDIICRFILKREILIRESDKEATNRILLITTAAYQSMIERQITNEVKKEKSTALVGTLLLDMATGWLQPDLAAKYNATEVYLYLPDIKQKSAEEIYASLTEQSLEFYIGLGNRKEFYFYDRLQNFGKSVAVQYPILKRKCDILNVMFNVTSPGRAAAYICMNMEKLRGKYVTLCNVHTSVIAYENEKYRSIQNNAALALPDGAPIAKLQKIRGFRDAERVAGPDLMEWMFEATMDGKLSHFFYGSTEETLTALEKNLKTRYPGINIRGMYSPPFRELTPEEEDADIRRINGYGADLIWVGLGAPKQEEWMARNAGRLGGLMLGVGAGFNFHAGTVKRAPMWVQRIGMEWFYRLLQEPDKLFKRYFITNLKFFIYLIKEH